METIHLPHHFSAEENLAKIASSFQGLSHQEVVQREKIFGKNVLKEEEISVAKIFFRQFHNILIYVLLAASVISALSYRIVDFLAIIFLVIFNALLGFWQELKAETSIHALKKLTESRETVIREGKEISVASKSLVPGDIVLLNEGETVTADMRIIHDESLMVDESSITGESLPVAKDHMATLPAKTAVTDQVNMLFAGSTVVRGNAKALVIRTGLNTYFASIVEKAQIKSVESPLTKAVNFFTKRYVVLLCCLFAFIGLYGVMQGRDWFEIGYIFIAELVSAVPEGLPIVVTLVLVLGALALHRKKTLIRVLPAVETLGSTTVIAVDKTGTITSGNLRVEKVYSLDGKRLERIAGLCVEEKKMIDPIDRALENWIQIGPQLRKKNKRLWLYPFDTRKRLMAAVYDIDGNPTLFVKGAFEALKKFSSQKNLELYEQEVTQLSKKGLRVLAFAEGSWHGEAMETWNIEIVGIVAFLDPPNEGVVHAVIEAQKAGMNVIMITGDHAATAAAIAKEVKICRGCEEVMTGEMLENFTDQELYEKLHYIKVIARILPEHKYRIVRVLQDRGEIVAVSGDGVNDVPALKAADLGIAMGSGTEAAKSVSKMVILDNNLKVIVEAIAKGRVIADNIRKIIYYLVSASVQEIFLISLAIFSNLPLPLFPIQILWINLVTDGVQDKTFPLIQQEGDVMQRKPRKMYRQFFDLSQVIRISTFGIVMGLVAFILFRYLLTQFTYEHAVTITFTSVVMSQWFNGIQAQKENEPFFYCVKKSFSINPYVFLSIGVGFFLQLFAVYIAQEAFHTQSMSWYEWRFPIFTALIGFTFVEIKKWIEFFIRSCK
ncbi:MAG: cation-transporting P-type ATPase [Parachlamydiales bacterium]|nr:cation-transporting P-type ATPase [Parachlamydiales bacterium]